MGRRLLALGCDPEQVRIALLDAGVGQFGEWYREQAEQLQPVIATALAATEDPSAPPGFSEEWLADTLLGFDRPAALWEVLRRAAGVDYSRPSGQQLVWAFRRLNQRGWLEVEGDGYALTTVARRSLERARDTAALGQHVRVAFDGGVLGRELAVSGTIARVVRNLLVVDLTTAFDYKSLRVTGLVIAGYGMDVVPELFGIPRRPKGLPVLTGIQFLTATDTYDRWEAERIAHPRRNHLPWRGEVRLQD